MFHSRDIKVLKNSYKCGMNMYICWMNLYHICINSYIDNYFFKTLISLEWNIQIKKFFQIRIRFSSMNFMCIKYCYMSSESPKRKNVFLILIICSIKKEIIETPYQHCNPSIFTFLELLENILQNSISISHC